MKAVASLGPEDLQLIDAPDPAIEAPTDAVVRVTTRRSAAPTCSRTTGTCPAS